MVAKMDDGATALDDNFLNHHAALIRQWLHERIGDLTALQRVALVFLAADVQQALDESEPQAPASGVGAQRDNMG
jgi:hypothetical protein